MDSRRPVVIRPRVVRPLLVIAASTLALWLVSAVAMYVYTLGAREPNESTLVIPEGTWERIAAGENPLQIPPTWTFQAEDRLVLINEDRVGHQLGPFYVPGRETRAFNLQPALGGALLCSLHPDGVITIDVDVRDFDWRVTMVPTFAFGPLVGLVLVGAGKMMRLVDEADDVEFS